MYETMIYNQMDLLRMIDPEIVKSSRNTGTWLVSIKQTYD
jgi:hypothetical protein